MQERRTHIADVFGCQVHFRRRKPPHSERRIKNNGDNAMIFTYLYTLKLCECYWRYWMLRPAGIVTARSLRLVVDRRAA